MVNAKPGPAKDSDKLSPTRSYASRAADTLGVNKRTVERDLARGKNITPDVLAEVTGTDLDKGVVLDELARTITPRMCAPTFAIARPPA